MSSEPFPNAERPADDASLSAEERALAARLSELRDLTPSDEVRARGAALLQQRIAATTGVPPRRARAWAAPAVQVALAIGAIVLALLGSGYATAQSLPGETFYPIKRDFEEAQVRLSSPAAQAELRLSLADRRLSELQRLVERAAPLAQIEHAADEYCTAVAQIGSEQSDTRLLRVHIGVLVVLKGEAAPAAQPALDRALAAARNTCGDERCAAPPDAPATTPTATATVAPSATATACTGTACLAPTVAPTRTPTIVPTRTPTIAPTRAPASVPTRPPTRVPTQPPTAEPTREQRVEPTETPKPERIEPSKTPEPERVEPTETPKPERVEPSETPEAERSEPTACTDACIAPTPERNEPPSPTREPDETKPPSPTREPDETKPPSPTREPDETKAPTQTPKPSGKG